jgi:hypothetical protein
MPTKATAQSPADSAAIRQILHQYAEAWLRNDEAGLLSLFEEAARISPSGLCSMDSLHRLRNFWFPKDGSISNPAISPDGQWLVFASGEMGGKGSADLFVSKNTGNGQWSAPVNLARLNSPFAEFAPAFHQMESTSTSPRSGPAWCGILRKGSGGREICTG